MTLFYRITTILFLCIFYSFSVAQSTEQNQNDTLKHLSKFNRFNKSMEGFVKKFPVPVISYSTETSLLFGLTKYNAFKFKGEEIDDDAGIQPSSVNSLLYYTLNKQFKFNIETDLMLKENKYNIKSRFTYLDFPELYFGTGNNTVKDSATNVLVRSLEFLGGFEYKFLNKFYAGISYSYLNYLDVSYTDTTYADGGDDLSENEGLQSGVGISLAYEGRDNRYNPYKGSYMIFHYNFFDTWLGSDFVFTKWSLDLRKYITIFPDKLILAGQLYTENVSGDVPIQALAFLGGTSRMRGIYEGRYRDFSSSSGQLEMRFPIFSIISGVMFGGIGQTAPDYSKYTFDQMHWAAGGGLRLMIDSKHRINIRLDYGISKDDSTIYFGFMEAF